MAAPPGSPPPPAGQARRFPLSHTGARADPRHAAGARRPLERPRSCRRLQMVGNALGKAIGDRAFAGRLPIFDAGFAHQMHAIFRAAESAGARRYIVGEDPVAALLLALL